MTSPVDREVLEAAQTLCMLAMGNRPRQDVNRDKAQGDDDCIITHVRPVAHRQRHVKDDETEDEDVSIITQARPVDHRYHPYRRPEPRQARPIVDRSRVLPNHGAGVEWIEIPRYTLPSLPGTFRNLAPLPRPGPISRPAPIQGPASFHQRPAPFHQGPVTFQSPAPFHQGPAPLQRPAHSLQGPTVLRKPLPSQKPAPVESPGPVRASKYAMSALALQVILALRADSWPTVPEMVDYLRRKYPDLHEKGPHKTLLAGSLCGALNSLMARGIVERSQEGPVNKWRIVPGARHEAIELAWTKKPDCYLKRNSSRWEQVE